MTRAEILDKAKECVCGQRERDYGKPEDNFAAIADLWSAYKGAKFSAEDVSVMMALMKIARIKTGTSTDDCFVDLAGYAACGGEIAASDKKGADDRNDNFRYGRGDFNRCITDKGRRIQKGTNYNSRAGGIITSKDGGTRVISYPDAPIRCDFGWSGDVGIKYTGDGSGRYILILPFPTNLNNEEDI